MGAESLGSKTWLGDEGAGEVEERDGSLLAQWETGDWERGETEA